MEPLAFARSVIAWRWTPCVAPVTGSVLIALLTLALVPDEIGGSTAGAGSLALRGKPDRTSVSVSDDTANDTNADGTPPARRPGTGRPRMPAGAGHGVPNAQELPSVPFEPSPPPPIPFTPPEPASPSPPPPDVPEPDMLPPPDVPLPPLGPGPTTPPGATEPATP
jgi:hypothetical protein